MGILSSNVSFGQCYRLLVRYQQEFMFSEVHEEEVALSEVIL